MSIETILKLHPCFVFAEAYQELCRPLKTLGITYFGHAIIREDGTAIGYSNDPEYLECYTKNNFFSLDLHTDAHLACLDMVHWDLLPRAKGSEEYYQANVDFNLYQLVTLIKQEGTEVHAYHFASDTPNFAMNTFYVQYRDLLEKFIIYYREELRKNKQFEQSSELILPIKKVEAYPRLEGLHHLELPQTQVDKFLNALQQPSIMGNEAHRQCGPILTKREEQCLALLARGYTAKTIAAHLDLTPRTVYFYLENIKGKIFCRTKSELASYYWQNFSDISTN